MKKTQLYYGRNVFAEALLARAPITELYVETRAAYEFVHSLPQLSRLNLKIQEGIPPQIKNEAHQGVVFRSAYDFYSPYSLEELEKFSVIAICNHVNDVHNLGSIARSCAAFGANLVIHEETKSASITPAVVKYSAGCAFKLKFMTVPDVGMLLQPLKKRNYFIAGLDVGESSVSLYNWKPQLPIALLLGSEGEGIDTEIRTRCDALIKVPTEKRVDSLNVSHAASVALSWVRHHRKGSATFYEAGGI